MSYNTITVEIDYDEADKIVVANLSSMLECLENDYELRKEDRGMAIFENDKKEDLKILKKHIKSFKTVLKYYGGDL
jgi:hypothetical protein